MMAEDLSDHASAGNPVMVTRRLRFTDSDIALGHKIWCPGCKSLHMPRSRIAETSATHEGPLWDWDGNETAPTFSPSYLSWWTDRPLDQAPVEHRCHSFIRAGTWQFLSDSTHELAEQTVAMVPLPDWIVRE